MNIIPMTIKEANEFVLNFHRHNKPTKGGKFAIGVAFNNEIWGIAIVGRPIARLLDCSTTAEITRTCTRPGAPKGACSCLYAACWRIWREMGGKRIITYTLITESGASLRGAGFKIIAECKPGSWNRTERPRDWQPIYGQQKIRWEKNEILFNETTKS